MQFIKYWPLIYEGLGTLESGITESLESGIHRHGIRNPNVGIRNPRCGIRNPRLAWIPLYGAIVVVGSGEEPLIHLLCSLASRQTRPVKYLKRSELIPKEYLLPQKIGNNASF